MLSFGNLLANVTAVCDEGYFTPEARVLLLLPLHHVLPLAGALMAPLLGGCTVVFATSLAGEDLVATLQRNASPRSSASPASTSCCAAPSGTASRRAGRPRRSSRWPRACARAASRASCLARSTGGWAGGCST